jgi:hypothetical protein
VHALQAKGGIPSYQGSIDMISPQEIGVLVCYDAFYPALRFACTGLSSGNTFGVVSAHQQNPV